MSNPRFDCRPWSLHRPSRKWGRNDKRKPRIDPFWALRGTPERPAAFGTLEDALPREGRTEVDQPRLAPAGIISAAPSSCTPIQEIGKESEYAKSQDLGT